MKKTLNLTLAGLLIFGFLAGQVNGQSVDDVLEMMIKAQAESFVRDALGYEALLNPRKHGLTYSIKGKETIEGNEYIVLEQKFSNDYTIIQYIDTKTYLPYKAVAKAYDQMMMETEGETIFTDYREVDDIVVAYNRVLFLLHRTKFNNKLLLLFYSSGFLQQININPIRWTIGLFFIPYEII